MTGANVPPAMTLPGDDGRVVTRALRAGYLVPLALASGWAALMLVLLGGYTDSFFAWAVGSRLSAATIGAAYTAGLAMFVITLRLRRWVDIRSTVYASMLLMALTFVITVAHRDDFHLGGGAITAFFAAWGWLLVHAAVPVLGLILLLWQSRGPGEKGQRPEAAPWWTALPIGYVGVVGTLLGGAMLLAPNRIAELWPWQVTTLDLRMMGVWTFIFGIGSALALWEADPERHRAGAVGYLVAGLGCAAALLFNTGEVDWGSFTAWLYLASMGGLALLGAAGWMLAGPAQRWADG